MKFRFAKNLTTQNKLIISVLIISTIFIVSVAYFAVKEVKNGLIENYDNFAQIFVKTLALNKNVENIESIFSTTDEVSYITFKDKNGNILYSSIDSNKERAKTASMNVSAPLKDSEGNIDGTVEVGLSQEFSKSIVDMAKNSMLMAFSAIWLIFTIVILINAVLIRRELTILYHGVKEIEKGNFGTVLKYNQTSGEIKELFDAFNLMSEKLHGYEEQNIEQITYERNKFEAVLLNIANGVVVCDSSDKIVLVNSSALKILGANEENIINTSIQDYCDSKGEYCFREEITTFKNASSDESQNKPVEINVNIDNSIIKSVISPMYSKTSEYIGYIIVLIDVTKEAIADRLKDDFISNVSHELRTPVTILTSYADTLYNFGDSFNFDEQKEFIGTINQEVIRLNNMVNDILDFSRLQSDRIIEKEKQNILDTIDKIVKSHKILADEKNISISVIKEENLPLVSYNAQSIERVLSNLITNAIKYSNKDSRVKIRAEISQDPKYLEVTVEDNGIGIAPEHQKMIFERFYRVENQVHTVKGTGLGLHLVKIAIEKHHQGKVFVKSTEGVGSTFGFLLPLDESDVKVKNDTDFKGKDELKLD